MLSPLLVHPALWKSTTVLTAMPYWKELLKELRRRQPVDYEFMSPSSPGHLHPHHHHHHFHNVSLHLSSTDPDSKLTVSINPSHHSPEHVSRAWVAKKPLGAPTYFYIGNLRSLLRSRSATSYSALRSAPASFCNFCSPLRSTRFSARSAP